MILCFCTVFSGCRKQDRDFILEKEGEEAVSEEALSQEEKPEISKTPSVTEAETLPSVTEMPEEIFVDVCGAVACPGVYALEAGSRVFQAIEAAGGFLPAAAGNCINQAQVMGDGQQIYVPTKEEAEGLGWKPEGQNQGTASEEAKPDQERINLNTAGSGRASNPKRYRRSQGTGDSCLQRRAWRFFLSGGSDERAGMKEGTFLKIKDKLAVE